MTRIFGPGRGLNLVLGSLLCVSAHAALALPATRPSAVAGPAAITSAMEAHDLSASEAVLNHPIHLRGVVTYYDGHLDSRFAFLFLHDASGSIFIVLPPGAHQTPAGTLIAVDGVSGLGDFAPIIVNPIITTLGTAPLPASAPTVSLTHLLSGQEDGQWVEVEGIVHSVYLTQFNVVLQLAMRDGVVPVTLPRDPTKDYRHLVDSKVKIHGNAAPIFNGGQQMVGARILTPDLDRIQIIDAGPADPFELPVRSIETLGRFNFVKSLPRRIHVRGRVTLLWPGSMLCVRDESHGICAEIAPTNSASPVFASQLAVDQIADVVGFVETSGSVPSLSDVAFRATRADVPVEIPPVTALHVVAGNALRGAGSLGAELIETEAELLGRDPAALDTTLVLSSGGVVFEAILPKELDGPASQQWRNGSRLRISGVCAVAINSLRSAREGGMASSESFRILLRSADDVVVLSAPSWWTPTHALMVLAAVLTITLLVLGWVVILTGTLKRQKSLIQNSEEKFRHLAQHDSVTGLPSRLLLRERLQTAIERAKVSGTGVGLLMLDLDRFKQINDVLGHHVGDQALKISARRICGAVRACDTVARISGDEFIVLVTDLHDPHEAEIVAAKIVLAVAAPFRVGDREVPLSASVGVYTAFETSLDADALMKRADDAMYHAKSKGRNRFQIYTESMARATEQHERFRSGLERALVANEFELHYQPMIDFRTRELTGFEALLRWRSAEMGLVMPTDFIPVAEQTGLIVPIGAWVIRQACREIGALEERLGRKFLLAINLSPRQIQEPDLPEIIRSCLLSADRDPETVEFEITESMLMDEVTQSALVDIRRMRARLAIDDFGIGFSSLSYITRFAIDRIKIDRSFIMKCMKEQTSLAVVRAVVAMAHGLSMTVVAEGVETAEEFHFLCDEGCDTAQGYYLSRPVPASELGGLVKRLNEWAHEASLTCRAV